MHIKPALTVAALALSLLAIPVNAAPILFQASLDGPSEFPPNASPATGFAEVTIDGVAHTMRVVVTFANLLGPNTAAHIHVINGPGDTNTADTLGPVATTTPTFTGFPSGTTAGNYDNLFDTTSIGTYRAGFITDAGGTTAAAEAALFAAIADGRAYLNIHSTNFPGGEIRGFLAPAAVPAPGTLVLLGIGMVGLALSRRKPS